MPLTTKAPKLVVHIGPGKCGSSTIQRFLSQQNEGSTKKTWYRLLSSEECMTLNNYDLDNSQKINTSALETILPENPQDYDVIVISRETLFQLPSAVRNICLLAGNTVSSRLVIGYSRKQSDFLISAYGQWFFRSTERTGEVSEILSKAGFDDSLFTGLERLIIAAVCDDFHSARQLSGRSQISWDEGYANLELKLRDLNTTIKCGVLPTKEHQFSLIDDFCEKAGLIYDSEVTDTPKNISNTSFHEGIIEAINHGVSIPLDMPGPHHMNDSLISLSSMMEKRSRHFSKFIDSIKMYIDSYYWSENKLFCARHDLSPEYFKPISHYSKGEVMEIVKKEISYRNEHKNDIINRYKDLSAELIQLCIKLSNK